MKTIKHNLQHLLSEEERSFFKNNGYLILKNVLSPDLLTQTKLKTDEIWEDYKINNSDAALLHLFNFIESDEIFLRLMALDETIIKVGQLLGHNIYVFHSHLDIHEPFEEFIPLEDLDWHRDSGIIESDLEDFNTHMFSMKVSFWLSDASEPDRGNMMVIPGSHKKSGLYPSKEVLKDAIPLLASPGDAVFFDRRIWHARSANVSGVTRKALFYGYSYRWLASRDVFKWHKKTDNLLWNQLLGCYDDPISRYKPKKEEVPLKKILEELNNGI